MERGNGRRNLVIWAQFQLLCLVHVPLWVITRLSLTSTTEAQVLGNRARGLLTIWREEEIAYVAGFFLKDIRNLKGKVDVFCFVYRASTATSML